MTLPKTEYLVIAWGAGNKIIAHAAFEELAPANEFAADILRKGIQDKYEKHEVKSASVYLRQKRLRLQTEPVILEF